MRPPTGGMIGRSIRRREDGRLLTGYGRFTAGRIAPAAVVGNAVSDALVAVDELLLEPEAVWQLWRARRAKVAATEGRRKAVSHVS